MAVQYSTTLRNNQLGAIESTVSTSPKLRIYTGTQPASCAAAATGTVLATIDLPSDWLAAPGSGSVAKSGTWSGTGSGDGTAGHFRIWDTAISVCHVQGSVTATGGGGDMTMNNTTIATSQSLEVTGFTVNAGNA